ncbi:MAG: response regulator [archaeon]|nr:MAG: response regulator [archaeon]
MKYERILWVDDNPADWAGSVLRTLSKNQELINKFRWEDLESRVTWVYDPEMAGSLNATDYDLIILDVDMPADHPEGGKEQLDWLTKEMGKIFCSTDLRDRDAVWKVICGKIHEEFGRTLQMYPNWENGGSFSYYLEHLVGHKGDVVFFSNNDLGGARDAYVVGRPFYFKWPEDTETLRGKKEKVEKSLHGLEKSVKANRYLVLDILRAFPDVKLVNGEWDWGEYLEESKRKKSLSGDEWDERDRKAHELAEAIPVRKDWTYAGSTEFVRDLLLAA